MLGLGSDDPSQLHSVYGLKVASEVEDWCHAVIEDRREHSVPVPHHLPISRITPRTQILSASERITSARRNGFVFSEFFDLLARAGITAALASAFGKDGPPFPGWTRREFSVLAFNALNGGADFDYESLFPQASVVYHDLKVHKFHMDEAAITASASGRSVLSTVDILTGEFMRRILEGLPSVWMERAAVLLDTRVPNTERAGLFHLWADLRMKVPRQLSLSPRAAAALYPPSAIRAFGDGSLEGEYDAFIPLSMCDFTAILAFTRSAMQWNPNAFVLPTGGVQPHEMKEGKHGHVQFSETDETFARLLVSDRRAYRAGLYGIANAGIADPLSAHDLLPTARRVCDTEGNADDVRARLLALRDFLGRPLRVGVVAPRIFAARACANFRRSIPTGIVSLGDIRAVIPSVPFFDATEAWSHWGYLIQFQVMISEYIKRLYMVCVS